MKGRREFLALGVTATAAFTAGCSSIFGGNGETTTETTTASNGGTTGETETTETAETTTTRANKTTTQESPGDTGPPTDASFAFQHNVTAGTVQITYDSGSEIDGNNLLIQGPNGSYATWRQLRQGNRTVRPGDGVTVGPDVENWSKHISMDDTVWLVYVSDSGTATVVDSYTVSGTVVRESLNPWRIINGNWTVEDGLLKQINHFEDKVAILNRVNVQNGIVEADVASLDGRLTNNIFWRGDAITTPKFYSFGFYMATGANEPDQFRFSVRSKEGITHLETQNTTSSPVPIESGEFYRLRVEFQGQTHRAYVDGTKIFEVEDDTYTERAGIGVHCGGNTAYKNFQYTKYRP